MYYTRIDDTRYLFDNGCEILVEEPAYGVRLRPPLSSINKKLYLLSSYCSISIATLRRDEVHLLRVSSHEEKLERSTIGIDFCEQNPYC